MTLHRRAFLGASALAVAGCGGEPRDMLLNASYDASRELYRRINRAFRSAFQERTGRAVQIRQSHGGSGSQARAVIDGLPADVVTLGLWLDIEAIRKKRGLLPAEWEKRLENRSLPYTSAIVFVVRKGNPYRIHDWNDLLSPTHNAKIITSNPKTSGGAKYVLLAAWGAAKRNPHWGIEPDEFIRRLYQRVPILESGARGASITFAERMQGDVQLAWENEAIQQVNAKQAELEVIYPESGTFRAEPPVAWLDETIDREGKRELAEAYLKFLYEPEAQAIIAAEGYRAYQPPVGMPALPLADRLYGLAELGVKDWNAAQTQFFADGGLFDRIFVAPGA